MVSSFLSKIFFKLSEPGQARSPAPIRLPFQGTNGHGRARRTGRYQIEATIKALISAHPKTGVFGFALSALSI